MVAVVAAVDGVVVAGTAVLVTACIDTTLLPVVVVVVVTLLLLVAVVAIIEIVDGTVDDMKFDDGADFEVWFVVVEVTPPEPAGGDGFAVVAIK